MKANAFNLNQKIYKRFYEFNDFQFVMVMPEGAEEQVAELTEELGALADTRKWKFIYASPMEIKGIFNSLETDVSLEDDMGTHTSLS